MLVVLVVGTDCSFLHSLGLIHPHPIDCLYNVLVVLLSGSCCHSLFHLAGRIALQLLSVHFRILVLVAVLLSGSLHCMLVCLVVRIALLILPFRFHRQVLQELELV